MRLIDLILIVSGVLMIVNSWIERKLGGELQPYVDIIGIVGVIVTAVGINMVEKRLRRIEESLQEGEDD